MAKNNIPIIPKFIERYFCPVCSSTKIKNKYEFIVDKKAINLLKKVYDYPQSKSNLSVFFKHKICICQCSNCELKYHKFVPSKKTLIYIYSILIDQKISFNKFKSNQFNNIAKSKELLKRLKSILKDNSFNKLKYLDFGFGWGAMLKASKYLNLIPYGIEQNPLQSNLIKKENIKVYSSVHNLINNHKDNIKFSIITLNQVLEHVTNPKDILNQLRKISDKNCILYISIPKYLKKNQLSDIDVFKKGPLQPFEHLNCFSRKSIKLLSKETDWELITCRNLFKNFSLFLKEYNLLIIILVMIHSKTKKDSYYLIPKT